MIDNADKLYEMVSSVKEPATAHIVTMTEVKIPMKYGIKGKVTRRFEGDVRINFDYTKMVNDQREKLGKKRDFTPKPLPWGTWDVQNIVITYNEVRYLRFYLNKEDSTYVLLVNGKPATDEEIAKVNEYLNVKGTAKVKEKSAEDNITPRTVRFSSVVSLTLNGKTYSVTEEE